MTQRLTRSRSFNISVLFPSNLHHTLFIFILVLLLIVSTTSDALTQQLRHNKKARDLGPEELDLNLEHHRMVVEEFKAKVLKFMGRTAPPNVGQRFNVSGSSEHGRLIRQHLRTKFNESRSIDLIDDEEDYDDNNDNYVDDLTTSVFHSEDIPRRTQLQMLHTSPHSPSLRLFKFHTNLQHPEVPYHDLVIKSAILRMRIKRQKDKLRRNVASPRKPLTISLYLMTPTEERQGETEPKLVPAFIRSINLKKPKFQDFEIDIESQLLSQVMDWDEKTVTFGISIHEAEVPDISSSNTDLDKTKHMVRQSQDIQFIIPVDADVQLPEEQVQVSKPSLQISTQTRDLRRQRAKRQASVPCTDGLCCRHSIYVNFADIGWSDWVISPRGFTAYFCKGDCPSRYKVATTFTNIKTLLHERNSDLVPAPTCAPTGYDPLRMMFFDGDVEEREYPEMVVTGCRCF